MTVSTRPHGLPGLELESHLTATLIAQLNWGARTGGGGCGQAQLAGAGHGLGPVRARVLTTSDAWESDVETQGHDPARQDLRVERIAPPPAIAQRIKLDPEHDVCVVRRHIRYIDDRPAIISDDFFDERIVRRTELASQRTCMPGAEC
jgi:hypothetical protein